MNDKFKAIVLNQSGENFSREIKNIDKKFLLISLTSLETISDDLLKIKALN